jgi:hypothetical protein
MAELTGFRDKNGNSAAHHVASMDFHRTVDAFFAAGSKTWIPDFFSDTPVGLLNRQPMSSDNHERESRQSPRIGNP